MWVSIEILLLKSGREICFSLCCLSSQCLELASGANFECISICTKTQTNESSSCWIKNQARLRVFIIQASSSGILCCGSVWQWLGIYCGWYLLYRHRSLIIFNWRYKNLSIPWHTITQKWSHWLGRNFSNGSQEGVLCHGVDSLQGAHLGIIIKRTILVYSNLFRHWHCLIVLPMSIVMLVFLWQHAFQF